MENIEINGITYQRIEEPNKTHSRGLIKALLMAAAMSSSYDTPYGGYSTYSRKRPKVDLVEEFKLIQEKKSKLCKSDRDWVMYQFNLKYKQLEQPPQ